MADDDATAIGRRVREYRKQKGVTASQLAREAGISRSYLSELENGTGNHRRPSATVLYALGKALGVAMSDLLGRPLIIDPPSTPPEGLLEFAREEGLGRSDIEMLASIRFRGDAPRTPERWRFIYQAIANSSALDSPREGR